jgi:carboxyl-terminal processing protease
MSRGPNQISDRRRRFYFRASCKVIAAWLIACSLVCASGAARPSFDADGEALIRHVFELLTQTFYRPLTSDQVQTGADGAILAYARRQGARNPTLSPHTDAGAANIIADVKEAAGKYHLDPLETAYAALHGMASSTHDRWTEFFTPKEFASFDAPLDPKSIYGIGILIGTDATTRFARAIYVIPNGPADEAGIAEGDVITEVSGTSTRGLSQEAITKLLRGSNGSVVHLVVRREGTDRQVSVIRASVHAPTVIVKSLPGNIGYIFVAVFAQPTADEFAAALERLQKQQTRAIVLDLRDDGGGYVSAAVSIASHFFGTGAVVTSVPRTGPTVTQDSDDEKPEVTLPVAVLVNGYTASASEILAGALHDNHAATLFGTRTFGKGVEQTVSRFPDGAAIKITSARYFTPANHDVNGKGIEPDVSIGLNEHAVVGDPGKDSQLEAALKYIRRQIAIRADSNGATPPSVISWHGE